MEKEKKYTLSLSANYDAGYNNVRRFVRYNSNSLEALLRLSQDIQKRKGSYWAYLHIMKRVGRYDVETLLHLNIRK